MNRLYCDICGREIQEDFYARNAMKTLRIETGSVTTCKLDLCKHCAERALKLLKKAAKQSATSDD